MADKATVFVTGKLTWAKVLPHQLAKNFDGNGKEWSFDLSLDDTSFLKTHKLTDRIKDKDDDRGKFIHLRKPEFDREGKAQSPYRIVDSSGQTWDSGELGNGTKADVKLQITDYGAGKKKGIYALAIRVQDHVPYESSDFAGMDNGVVETVGGETKSYMSSNAGKEMEELDDDVPF